MILLSTVALTGVSEEAQAQDTVEVCDKPTCEQLEALLDDVVGTVQECLDSLFAGESPSQSAANPCETEDPGTQDIIQQVREIVAGVVADVQECLNNPQPLSAGAQPGGLDCSTLWAELDEVVNQVLVLVGNVVGLIEDCLQTGPNEQAYGSASDLDCDEVRQAVDEIVDLIGGAIGAVVTFADQCSRDLGLGPIFLPGDDSDSDTSPERPCQEIRNLLEKPVPILVPSLCQTADSDGDGVPVTNVCVTTWTVDLLALRIEPGTTTPLLAEPVGDPDDNEGSNPIPQIVEIKTEIEPECGGEYELGARVVFAGQEILSPVSGTINCPGPITTPAYPHEVHLHGDRDGDGVPAGMTVYFQKTAIDPSTGFRPSHTPTSSTFVPVDTDDGDSDRPVPLSSLQNVVGCAVEVLGDRVQDCLENRCPDSTSNLCQDAVNLVKPIACLTVTPTSGTTSTVFQFDASCSSDPTFANGELMVRWDWESDGNWDTSFSTTKQASHQYSTSGTKTATVEVVNPASFRDRANQGVNVDDPPQACFDVSPSSGTTSTVFSFDPRCTDDDFTSDGSISVRWDFEDDGTWDKTSNAATSVFHSYSTASEYLIRLEVTDSAGQTDMAFETVEVDSVPEACFDATVSGLSVQVDASCSHSPGKTITGYHWRWGDGSTGSGQTAAHGYTVCPGGTFTIRLKVTDSNGVTGWESKQVSVEDTRDSDGDLLIACREAQQGTSDNDRDADDDGLSDYVESAWYPTRDAVFCGNVNPCQDYPDPLTPDLYLEVDFMQGSDGHRHIMTSAVRDDMVAMYAAEGMNLHIDTGNLGHGGTLLPDQEASSIYTLRTTHRNNDDDFPEERNGFFRYMVMAHYGPPNVCGQAFVNSDFGVVWEQMFQDQTGCFQNNMHDSILNIAAMEHAHNFIGTINPPADRYRDPDTGDVDRYHDRFDGFIMWPFATGATDFHDNRWDEMRDEGVGAGLPFDPENLSSAVPASGGEADMLLHAVTGVLPGHH